MRKQLAAAGLTAGLAVGGVAGFAFASGSTAVGAQSETTTTTAPAAPPTDHPDRSAHIEETLKPLVDDGTITQAQADKVTQALIAAAPKGGPDGDGRRGPGGMGRGGFGFGGGAGLDAAAKALGTTTDDLLAELKKGTSIADIAKSKGVDLSKITDALVAEAKARLDEQVKAGNITQAQADERVTRLSDRITEMVNGKLPLGGPGRGGPGGWGHGPKDGAAPDAPAPAPTTPPATDAPTTTEG